MKYTHQKIDEIIDKLSINDKKKLILSFFRSLLWIRVWKLLYETNESLTLSEITKKLNEKGLMVVKKAINKLCNYCINGIKINILNRTNITTKKYKITTNGIVLWKKLFENDQIISDLPNIIDKYIMVVQKVREKDIEFRNDINKINIYIDQISNFINSNSLELYKEEIKELKIKINKKRTYINNSLKDNDIDTLLSDISIYINLKKELYTNNVIVGYFKELQAYKSDLLDMSKDLLFNRDQLNHLSKKLRIYNFENIEIIVNDIDEQYLCFLNNLDEILSLKLFDKKIKKITDILLKFENL
jgi:hypothetical protein